MHWLHDSGGQGSDSHSAMITYNLDRSFLSSFLISVSSFSLQEHMICKGSFKKWKKSHIYQNQLILWRISMDSHLSTHKHPLHLNTWFFNLWAILNKFTYAPSLRNPDPNDISKIPGTHGEQQKVCSHRVHYISNKKLTETIQKQSFMSARIVSVLFTTLWIPSTGDPYSGYWINIYLVGLKDYGLGNKRKEEGPPYDLGAAQWLTFKISLPLIPGEMCRKELTHKELES